MASHESLGETPPEVAAGRPGVRERRFAFGENWRRFLPAIDERRIAEAETSMRAMLGCDGLEGKTFLDIGSGSGLSSLAARRMGARVRSFDLDPASVWCTQELRRRYFPDDPAWSVEQASVLDGDFIRSLGRFDVVYSWGVLHHTGALWKALEQAGALVRSQGLLFIAIYNDQGRRSRYWLGIKKTYCRFPPARPFIALLAGARLWGPALLRDLLTLRPWKSWRDYSRERGMSPWRDVIDWVGGYPFEVAKPEEIFDFFTERGFTLRKLRTVGGTLGNNQFVFRNTRPEPERRA